MVPYVNYNELDEFYTLKGVCDLLKMDKEALRKSCKKYDINPQRNEIGYCRNAPPSAVTENPLSLYALLVHCGKSYYSTLRGQGVSQ